MWIDYKKNIVLTVSLIFQIILLLVLIIFNNYINYIILCYFIFSLILLLGIIKNSLNISLELPFIIIIILFPIISTLIILTSRKNKEKFQKVDNNINESFKYLIQDKKIDDEIKTLDYSNLEYISKFCHYPITKNNEIKYFSTCEDIYKSLIEELTKAKKFIFIEFLIINDGKMWQQILSILENKAKVGVEVRIIYDYSCSHKKLPKSYPDKLVKKGIKCIEFNKTSILSNIIMNNRDHRKIVVIDGITAFTGGFNIADEYINIIKPYGYWKDNGIELKGESVWSFTVMFLSFWNAYKHEDNKYNNFKAIATFQYPSNSYVVPFSDNSLDKKQISKNIYLNIINQAKEYVYIFTPYLIIDDIILNALILTSKRGVDVRIITPGVPDKKIVYNVTTSYFKNLVNYNIKVYTYTGCFLHSKMIIADDKCGLVGSINLDYRSLYLNFECGVYIQNGSVIKDIKKDVIDTISKSHLVTKKEIKGNVFKNMYQAILKLFGPFM